MKNTTSSFWRCLHAAEDAGRIVTIVSMTAIIFFQVVARAAFKWSSPALEEAARFIMVWSIFIGAVVTTREDSHIRMGGILRSERGRQFFELISQIVTLLFLCIFVKWSFDFAAHSWNKSMNSIVLRVPLIAVHICFLVTGILMTVHTASHLIDHAKRILLKGREV